MNRRRVATEQRSAQPTRAALAKKAAKSDKASAEKPSAGSLAEVVARETAAAVADFESAIKKLQKKDFAGAAKELKTIVDRHPSARHIHDRVGSYLRICERELDPPTFEASTADDHYSIGIVHLNRGELDGAIEALSKATGKSGSDGAEFALAVAHANRQEPEVALAHLRKAIELNGDNRILAANDSDLQMLRDEPEFVELMAGVAPGDS